jgi:hypothetical protein
VWAVIVDVMGVAMILWAVTGAIMWWSLRGTRALGAAALLVGVAVLVILAGALWAAAAL